MSIGSWDPAADEPAHAIQIDPQQLLRFAGWSESDQLDQLEQLLSPIESQQLAGLMHFDAQSWLTAATPLTNAQLHHLIRFFAVAENLPGWEAGEKSPVIPLAKTLRQRGERLDKDFLQWLRSVNNNRFLPYGPL